MEIDLFTETAVPGGIVQGRVLDGGEPQQVEVQLVQNEIGMRAKKRLTDESVATQSEVDSGEFSLQVPPDAIPTVDGQRVHISWAVEVKGQWLASDTSHPVLVSSSPDGGAAPPVGYRAGEQPRIIRGLRNEHLLSISMAAAIAVALIAAAIALNVAESEASSGATLVATIVLIAVSLFPIATVFLAARTIWPSTVEGFVPHIEPPTVQPGGTIRVTSADPWPKDLGLVCIETYQRNYGRPNRNRSAQYETFEHSHRWVVGEEGVAQLRLPSDAASSYDGETAQIRWVLRRGGKKIGRWGPIRRTEWAIIVA